MWLVSFVMWHYQLKSLHFLFGPFHFLLSLNVSPPLFSSRDFWLTHQRKWIHHFPLEVSWKDWGKIRGKECKTECEGVRRGEGSQSPWGLSFSSPHLTPPLSSPLLVWKHNHSLWVSVHILTIFWWGQEAERVKRVKKGIRLMSEKSPQATQPGCLLEEGEYQYHYTGKLCVICLFLVFNTPQRNTNT